MSSKSPIEQLLRLCQTEASGEFICATDTVELHVFVQKGRIAWATDSRKQFAFAARLQERANIDVTTFRQIVEECRRERLPLGETLVRWGVASWDLVRESLFEQLRNAIACVREFGGARTLFLERRYAPYDERLTFSAEDMIDERVLNGVRTHLSPTPASSLPGLARRLRTAVAGVEWLEVLEHGHLVDVDPFEAKARSPLDLQERTLASGSDFVAVRSARGSVVGLKLNELDRSLWCGLEPDCTFGAIVSALWSVTAMGDRDEPRGFEREEVVPWSTRWGSTSLSREIATFMDRAKEVLGVLVFRREQTPELVLACGAPGLDQRECVELVKTRMDSLLHCRLPLGSTRDDRLSSIGFYLRTMVTGESKLWCFGAELGAEAETTLWLLLDRRSAQGLGWAYLSALSRTVVMLPEETAP